MRALPIFSHCCMWEHYSSGDSCSCPHVSSTATSLSTNISLMVVSQQLPQQAEVWSARPQHSRNGWHRLPGRLVPCPSLSAHTPGHATCSGLRASGLQCSQA